MKVFRKIVKNRLLAAKRHFLPSKGGKPRVFILESEIQRYLREMPDAVEPPKHRPRRERVSSIPRLDVIEFL